MDTEFVKRVKYLRSLLRVNQEHFGKMANVTKQAVSAWETGKVKPQREALAYLAKTANVNADWLLDGCGEPFVKRERCVREDRANYEASNSDEFRDDLLVLPLNGLTVAQRREIFETRKAYIEQNRAALNELSNLRFG